MQNLLFDYEVALVSFAVSLRDVIICDHIVIGQWTCPNEFIQAWVHVHQCQINFVARSHCRRAARIRESICFACLPRTEQDDFSYLMM